MKASFRRPAFLTASLFAALLGLTACGGGSDAVAPPPTDSPTNADKQAAFVTDFSRFVTTLDTYGGLTNSAAIDLYDDGLLDAGYTKTQLREDFAQEAAAMAVAADLSAYPMGRISAATISACDAANVCTLTATLTNTDADTTTVTFSTQVKYSNGKFRLYGDQKSA